VQAVQLLERQCELRRVKSHARAIKLAVFQFEQVVQLAALLKLEHQANLGGSLEAGYQRVDKWRVLHFEHPHLSLHAVHGLPGDHVCSRARLDGNHALGLSVRGHHDFAKRAYANDVMQPVRHGHARRQRRHHHD